MLHILRVSFALVALVLPQALAGHSPPMDLPWDSFGFSLNDLQTDYMYLDTITATASSASVDGAGGGPGLLRSGWSSLTNPPLFKQLLRPFGAIPLPPSATVLNYGQGLFEGLKAFRRADGTIVVFRPDKNAARCRSGCARLLIPPVPDAIFIEAVAGVVAANARFVPPTGVGALYLRPLVFGSGAKLGVAASDEFTFCVWASPVGNYFKTKKNSTSTSGGSSDNNDDKMLDGVTPITLLASRSYSRSAPGSVGGVKAIGNYAPCFKGQKEAKDAGFNDALFLDAKTGEYVEEAGASNFFAFFPDAKGGGGTLVTPPLDALTILPGATRDSIITLVKNELSAKNIRVEERPLKLSELRGCKEAFCCGTGASITPVGTVVFQNANQKEEVFQFGEGKAGDITNALYKMLYQIQWGTDSKLAKKYEDWIMVVDPIKAASSRKSGDAASGVMRGGETGKKQWF
jgi:branched-chain amino acid aminotransferase